MSIDIKLLRMEDDKLNPTIDDKVLMQHRVHELETLVNALLKSQNINGSFNDVVLYIEWELWNYIDEGSKPIHESMYNNNDTLKKIWDKIEVNDFESFMKNISLWDIYNSLDENIHEYYELDKELFKVNYNYIKEFKNGYFWLCTII